MTEAKKLLYSLQKTSTLQLYKEPAAGYRSSDSRCLSCNNMAKILSSNQVPFSEVKTTKVAAGEVKQLLQKRLKSLEDEAELSKHAFFQLLEERKKLMDEIYLQLQIVRQYLPSKNQVKANKSYEGALNMNPLKEGRSGTGLSELLHQESDPGLLLVRDVRVNTVALVPTSPSTSTSSPSF